MSTLDVLLAIVGALGVVIVAFSARLRQWPVTEPLLALVAGIVLGPAVLGVFEGSSLKTVDMSKDHQVR